MKRVRMCVGLLAVAGVALAGDWTKWRGSQRNGVASDSPALLDTWGTNGPVKLWQSEPIPSGEAGGFSSITVAGGREYVFVNWKTNVPCAARKLSDGSLRQLGWFPDKLPDDLVKSMEEARVSEERAKLNGPALRSWIDAWVTNHVPEDQRKALVPVVAGRLQRGKSAMPIEGLSRLAEIRDKEFAGQEALDAWMAGSGLASNVCAAALKLIPTTRPEAKDVVLCLDADGKTVWKKEYAGRPSGWGSSSTVAIRDGRCHVAGGKTLYCLDAASGHEIWKKDFSGGDVSSSPVILDGTVAILAHSLHGFDAADGRPLWELKGLGGVNGSPAVWQKDGQSYVLCNTVTGIVCVEPKTGRILWTVPGGGSGTVTVAGDMMVLQSEKKEVGLVAYRLAADKAQQVWKQDLSDRGTTPVIFDGHVYSVGASRVGCWALTDGAVKWEQKVSTEIASPILADGKIFALIGGALHMIRATPEKYTLLGKAPVGAATCSSPSVADGRLYLRLVQGVACYDLCKKP